MTSSTAKKLSASKSLCLFTNILDVKPKTEKLRFVAEKSKRKSMKFGTGLCTKTIKQKGNSKINDQIKRHLYLLITRTL